MEDRDWITTDEACRLLGVHRTTLWRFVKQGKITPHRRPGERANLFRRTDVLRLREPVPSVSGNDPAQGG